ncbi:MAG: cadherin domain-containing protein [Candidatus Odinarchaeota archaeon]
MKKFIIIPFLFINIYCSATNYYVRNGGNDSNSGLDDANAWAHHPWMSTWTGNVVLAPGDTVHLKRGSTWSSATPQSAFIQVKQNGTTDNHITTTWYGSSGNKPLIQITGDFPYCVIQGTGRSYITFDHLEIKHFSAVRNMNPYQKGIVFGQDGSGNISHDWVITNCDIHDIPYTGISGTTNSYNIVIGDTTVTSCATASSYSNHIYDCGYAGAGMGGRNPETGKSNWYVNYNYVHDIDIEGPAGRNAYGIYFTTAPSSDGWPNYCVARFNLVENIDGWEGIDTHGGSNTYIQDNHIYNCYSGVATQAAKTHPSDTILDSLFIERNIIENPGNNPEANFYFIQVTGATNSVIRNNILFYSSRPSKESGAYGIKIHNSDGVISEKNLFYNGPVNNCSGAIQISGSANNITVRKNWIYNWSYGVHVAINTSDGIKGTIEVNNNIIHSHGIPFYVSNGKFSGNLIIYNNNFISDANAAVPNIIYLRPTVQDIASLIIKNNILGFTSPTSSGIYINSPATITDILDANNNIYWNSLYPNPFYLDGVFTNWTNWKTSVYDTLSLFNINPGFKNTSGLFLKDTDFILDSNSLAINAGTYVGLNEDYFGNQIIGKPQIGACKYHPSDISEINHPPTIPVQKFQISEEYFAIIIDTINATDEDGDLLNYTILEGNENDLFALDNLSGQLRFTSSTLDFTGNPSFNLLIRVTDDGGLFDEKIIPVYLYAADENIPPTISPQYFQVSELDFSQIIDSISAIDQNGDNISYSIISGNDEEIFNLDAETGQLSFSPSADINFIGNPSYILGIRVTDDGIPTQFSETEITILLYAFEEDNPPKIDNQVFDILENDIVSNFIGVILAEAGDNGQSIQYSIESGNEQGLFSLDAESGNLYFTTYPQDFYSIDQYELHVRVTDNGPDQLSDIATITINLIPSEKVYYIDPDNSLDTEIDGFKEHPYNSWSDVAWEDGAIYIQKCGTEAKENKLLITADNVTISSYGTGQLPILISTATDYAIKVLDKHDIIIKNLHIVAEDAIGCVYFLGEKCENNVLEHCKLEGADYGLRIIDGTSYTVKYNVFNNNVDGIYTIAQDAEIFYNVFKGNQLAVNLSSYSVNAKIYNNVFYDNRQGVSTSYAEILLYNNIFYMTQSGDQALNLKLDQLVSDNNIFYPEQTGFIVMKDAEYGSLAEYQDLTGLDLNSMTVDPLFMDIYSDNFSVTKESHAIDAGKLVGLTQDFYGKAVPSGDAPDIGLSEAAFDLFTSLFSAKSNEADLWSVYPNPSAGKFSLKNNLTSKSKAEILIYDVSGDIIYQQMFYNQGMQVNEINLSSTPKGVYILSIETDNNKQTQKIIIK